MKKKIEISVNVENPTDPKDFQHLTDQQLDSYLRRFCLEVSDQDLEEFKPLRNAIEELRARYNDS